MRASKTIFEPWDEQRFLTYSKSSYVFKYKTWYSYLKLGISELTGSLSPYVAYNINIYFRRFAPIAAVHLKGYLDLVVTLNTDTQHIFEFLKHNFLIQLSVGTECNRSKTKIY